MVIAVLVKRVPDTASVFKIASDGKSVEAGNLKYVISPYDEHAIEEAIKLKEAKEAEVVIVSAGGDETKETIRTALAMGADYAVLVKDDALNGATPRGTAKALAGAVKTLNADIVFAGKQAVDDDASQVPERVAELLDMPHASVVSKFDLGDGSAAIEREVEGGNFTLEVPLPAVFAIQKGINQPRYPSLPNIMKAKKKEIKELSLGDIGVSADDVAPGIEIESMHLPRQERLQKVIEGDSDAAKVSELVKILREDEKVL